MDVRRSNEGPEHIYVVVFAGGEDVIRGLEDFARTEGLRSGNLTAVGTFRRAVLGVCGGRCECYERIPVENPCDVVVLVGTIDGAPGRPELHLRAVLGTRGGRTLAGRLLEAEVCSILEVIVSNGSIGQRHPSLQRRVTPGPASACGGPGRARVPIAPRR